MTIGDSNGTGNTGDTSTLQLGLINTINTDTFTVGGRKSLGEVTIDTGGTLTLNGKGGVGTEADLLVGNNSAPNTGVSNNGVFDMSGGILNATLDQLTVGSYAGTTGGGSGNGSFTLDAGTVTANAVTLASSGGVNASNTDGIVNQNGGEIIVSGAITSEGGTAEYNLAGGTLRFLTVENNGGTFDFNFTSGVIQNLAGQDLTNVNVDVTLVGAGPQTITIDDGQTGTFQSNVSIGGGTAGGTLVKNGDGLLVLEGPSTYTSDTQIDAGTLSAENTSGSATGTGEVTVKTGTYLTGNGVVGKTTVEDGGFISPGVGATLGLGDLANLGTGDLLLRGNSTYQAELGDANATLPNLPNDSIVVSGDVKIEVGADLDLLFDPSFVTPASLGDSFTLIDNLGSNAVDGTFDGYGEGSIISLNTGGLASDLFQITYQGGDGNDVVLSALGVKATTGIRLDGTTLVIEDIDGEDTDDRLTVKVVGNQLVVTDPNNPLGHIVNGAQQTDLHEVRIGTGLFTDVRILTNGGEDSSSTSAASAMRQALREHSSSAASPSTAAPASTPSMSTASPPTFADDDNLDFDAEKIIHPLRPHRHRHRHPSTSAAPTRPASGAGMNYTGLWLYGSDLTSELGDITLAGQGGDTGSSSQGVKLTNDSQVTTSGGSIDIDGTGGGTGSANQGVAIFHGSDLAATGGGNISIDGTSTGGTVCNDGVTSSPAPTSPSKTGTIAIAGTAAGSPGGTQPRRPDLRRRPPRHRHRGASRWSAPAPPPAPTTRASFWAPPPSPPRAPARSPSRAPAPPMPSPTTRASASPTWTSPPAAAPSTSTAPAAAPARAPTTPASPCSTAAPRPHPARGRSASTAPADRAPCSTAASSSPAPAPRSPPASGAIAIKGTGNGTLHYNRGIELSTTTVASASAPSPSRAPDRRPAPASATTASC